MHVPGSLESIIMYRQRDSVLTPQREGMESLREWCSTYVWRLTLLVSTFTYLYQSNAKWGSHFAPTTSDAKQSPLTRKRSRKIGVSTLNPDLLQAKDFMDLSSKQTVVFGVGQHPRWVYSRGPKRVSFPQGSRGFFYYNQLPGLPNIAGEICFRLTSTSTPASFHLGTDLMPAHGMPWRIQVFRTANAFSYRHMWDMLLLDGLTSQSILLERQKTLSSHNTGIGGVNYMFAIDQPFPFTFNKLRNSVWAVVGGKMAEVRLDRIFSQRLGKKITDRRVFAGRATVRLELSRAPEPKENGTPHSRPENSGNFENLVLNYEGHLQCPTEGSYLVVHYPGKEPEPYFRGVFETLRHIFDIFEYEKIPSAAGPSYNFG